MGSPAESIIATLHNTDMQSKDPFVFNLPVGCGQIDEPVNLPLNRSEYNFLVTETNYGIKKNLKNIIYLELTFDGPKEIDSSLKVVNNWFVEKEFAFTINVLY